MDFNIFFSFFLVRGPIWLRYRFFEGKIIFFRKVKGTVLLMNGTMLFRNRTLLLGEGHKKSAKIKIN